MIPALLFISITSTTLAAQGPETSPAARVAVHRWGDVDGDALDDLLVIHAGTGISLYRNRGDGEFDDLTALLGLVVPYVVDDAQWVDLNSDGWLDLYLRSSEGVSRVFRSDMGARFVDVTSELGLERRGSVDISASWRDYDQDGYPDFLVRTTLGDHVYHNTGVGDFERLRLSAPPGASNQPAFTAGTNAPTVGWEDPDQVPGPPNSASGEGRRRPGPADRRGAPSGTQNSTLSGPPSSVVSTGPSLPAAGTPYCPDSIRDQALLGNCILAATIPTLGLLYPMSIDLNVDGSGFVGIGTTTPQSKLDVRDSGFGERTILTLRTEESVPGTSGRLDWAQSGTVSARIRNTFEAAGQAGLSFHTYDSPSLGEALRLTHDGRVGMGTSDPTANLHVYDSSGDTSLLVQGEGTQLSQEIHFKDSGSDWFVGNRYWVDEDGFGIGRTNGKTDFVIDSAGRVGVGNQSPARSLHVNGGDATLMLEGLGTDFTPAVIFQDSTSAWHIGARSESGAEDSFGIGRSYVKNDVIVSDAGDVGIGGILPGTKLDVQGTIRSRVGGFVFPDGTSQSSAQLVGPTGPQGPPGPKGDPGPQGPPVTTVAACGSNSAACSAVCGGIQYVFVSQSGPCSVTSDTGSCANTHANGHCCVCVPHS